MRPVFVLVILIGLSACASSQSRAPELATRMAHPAPQAGSVALHGDAVASRGGALQGHRRAAGLRPLVRSPRLDAAARGHARDMAANGFFSHKGSNGSSHTRRIRAQGCSGGAENIAEGTFTARSVMDAWMGSAGHRRNMLLPAVTHYGLAKAGDKWVLKLSRDCP